MIKPITTPGKTYAVTSPNGCTVTTEDGLTLAEIEAGKQGYFVAVSGKVLLSDDAAVLTQLFKLAPQQRLAILGVLGGGVPAWFKALKTELTALLDGSKFELAWLAGEKKLVVHTDRVSVELGDAVTALLERVLPQDVEVVRYNHNMEISWRDINKYAACTNTTDMRAVNPDYKKDLTSDGEWVYPLPNLTSAWQIFTRANIRRITIDLPKATNLQNYVAWSYTLNYVAGEFPAATLAYYMFEMQPYLTEAYMKMPAVTTLDNAFPDAKLNKESVLMIIEHIPAYTSGSHPFTIGIHIDHQTDDEVLKAIANAESKGWTLTVRWNGTPTAKAATTYGLRKPPIYARVSEHERPDGTTERYLDWGHYVTDPTSYEEFRSVEAAEEYFNIKPTE